MNTESPAPEAQPRGKASRLPAWARWTHLYGSMLGLGALLFFSLTGITLNHPDWTLGSVSRTEKRTGRMELRWLAPGGPEAAVDRLAIAEELRRTQGIRGLVEDFRVEARECSVVFKGPGSSADVVIDRQTGAYTVESIHEGWVALLNDLHKGRHTGRAWSVVIDASATLLALVSATGLWLLLHVRRRRASGLWVGLLGAGALAVLAAGWAAWR